MRYSESMNWKPATFSNTKPIEAMAFELTAADQQTADAARQALQAHIARLNALDTYPRRKEDNEQ